jgi:hypothetical protein
VVPVSELHIDFFIAAVLQDREEDRGLAAFERLLGAAAQVFPIAVHACIPTGSPPLA